MILSIIILSVIGTAAVALIFCLIKVLKNTLNIADNALKMTGEYNYDTAYNGIYHNATVITLTMFDQAAHAKIVDWSRYEKDKIVSFIYQTPDPLEKYTQQIIQEYENSFNEEIDEETKKIIYSKILKPRICKNSLVYEIEEGNWQWKSADS